MKIKQLMLLGFILLCKISPAQRVITVQSGNNVSMHYSLDSAMAHAVNGDQIYIPGGVFTIPNFIINKSVMIFGAGHYPDSSIATGETFIMGNVILKTGASAGLITGCSISGNVIVGTGAAGADSVSNYSIHRCSFNNLYLSPTGAPPTNARNYSISENVIRGAVLGANAQSINISKNILQGSMGYLNSASISNNDFIGLGNCTTLVKFLNAVSSCTFDNNIFLFSPPACAGASFFDSLCINNIFTNNLFKMTMTFPSGSNNGTGNIFSQPVVSIFMNAAGDVFYYTSDYHLKITSPGVHAGTDGYDVGIYGSMQPYKAASIPFNPHIQSRIVDSFTNPQGQLNIQIKAAAQDY